MACLVEVRYADWSRKWTPEEQTQLQACSMVVNERCQVAVAGLGLLTVDTVQVEEDLCTDKLQALLDEGWRILAVCVQPDQRRPDYILGRSKGRQE